MAILSGNGDKQDRYTNTDTTDTSNHPILPKRRRGKLVRTLIIALILVCAAASLTPVALGAGGAWSITRPGCSEGGRTPAVYNLVYMPVVIPSRSGHSYRGFFVPGTLDATIILPPTYSAGRDGAFDQLAIFAEHGYSVLIYESRPCAGIAGLTLGYSESEDVDDALTYLEHNPDGLPIKLNHVGLFGFSMAGVSATLTIARNPQIGALALEGNYTALSDFGLVTDPHSFVESLLALGWRLGYQLSTGQPVPTEDPITALLQVPPRPILLIYGSIEGSLPSGKNELAAIRSAAPNESIELWIVPGANHGGYMAAAGRDVYAQHLLTFYDCALLNQSCDAYHALWTS